MRRLFAVLLALSGASVLPAATPSAPVAVPKAVTRKLHVHVMPWYETRTSSGNGAWGMHWTMANRNPDMIEADGRRQIASYYYPLTGPYASGDKDLIEYQLLLMKYSGVDGVLLDWPGSQAVWDYPKNRQNAEAMIRQTAKFGLKFAVVYEDHNLRMAHDAGLLPDMMTAAQQDMAYLRDNYFPRSNYIRLNSAPLLLDFGPQTFLTPGEWSGVFAPFTTKPTFLTLWYQSQQAGANAQGEFAWIYSDGMAGLDYFYANRPLGVKFGVAYPGFHTFYAAGGWGGPGWSLPYGSTFAATLDKAKAAALNAIQVATWNDYGEGSMIEPTREFGYTFLTTLQQKFGVSAGQGDLQLIYKLYEQRKQYAGNAAKQDQLDQAMYYLASYQVAAARAILDGAINEMPIGFFDVIYNGWAYGWAIDKQTATTPVTIHVYIDGPAGGGGTLIGAVVADRPRPDVNSATGLPGNHGFAYPIPTQFHNQPHRLYLYAIDSWGGPNPLLPGSPRGF